MKKSSLALVCISILLVRWWTAGDTALSEGERVRVAIPTIDFPEYTETQTVVKRGKWEVRIPGYTEIMPGDVVEAEGLVDERGRVKSEGRVRIMNHELWGGEPVSMIDKILIGVSYVRRWAVGRLQTQLPEPMASLAAGILLGVKARMPRDFYEALVNTGTLHIVAASGFNVMIVANLLMIIFGKVMRRGGAIATGIGGVIMYVLLAGGSASVVRAGIMGSLTLMAKYLGRQTEAKWLVWVTVFIMVMVEPTMVTDIGFQLSVSATMGLLYLEPMFGKLQILNPKSQIMIAEIQNSEITKRIHGFVKDYLWPTLAATVATAPVIVWHFGRLSLIGVGVNLLILPLIPLIMLLTALALVVPGVNYLLYVPLWWVGGVIRLFG